MTEEEYLRKRMNMIEWNSHYGIMIDTEITDIVRRHIKRLEEMKMKATSVQKIENVKEMHFTIEKNGVSEITKVIVGASTNDDIFEFHFSGVGCVVFADQWFNMVAEKAYKVDFESERNKRKMMETENNILRKKIKELEEELTLEKAANEAQRKFIKEYAGKGTEIEFNYAIGDDDEDTYVIVNKEEYEEKIKELENQNKKILDTNQKLQEKIFYLERLKTPTIENFTDEEPSSRRDILRCAEKCVCGHREQDYGTPESNFQLIADLWNDYLFPKLKENKDVISAMDVAMMMALMKVSRIRNGGGSGDSFVDLAGYAACGGEIWAEEKKKKDQN